MVITGVSTPWIGVIGALGGVLITSLIGLVTAVLNHRWQRESSRGERSDRLQEKRAETIGEAYARYFAAVAALETHLTSRRFPEEATSPVEVRERLSTVRDEAPERFDAWESARALARLAAGDSVLGALVDFDEKWIEACVRSLCADNAAPSDFEDVRTAEVQLISMMRAEQAELLR